MPRQARLDAPGVLHHIMIRGIARRKIFINDRDREDFLDRLTELLPETQTACYAIRAQAKHLVSVSLTMPPSRSKKVGSVSVVPKNHRTFDSPGDNVMQGPGCIYPRLSRHDHHIAQKS